MPSFRVVTEGGEYTFENESVENVAQLVERLGPALGIGPNANIAINGSTATGETEIPEGAEVTTTKPAGRKG
jgi:hypothetical protein